MEFTIIHIVTIVTICKLFLYISVFSNLANICKQKIHMLRRDGEMSIELFTYYYYFFLVHLFHIHFLILDFSSILQTAYLLSNLLWLSLQVVGTAFTHHQKCVLLDTQASGNNRKITAFIGGLDLCDGRYDTPQHRIFKDLDTVFEGDYHQPTFPVSSSPVTSWNCFVRFRI